MNTQWLKESLGGAATILAAALIVVALIGSWTVSSARSYSHVLSVTGSTKERVNADAVRWVVRAQRIVVGTASAGAFNEVAADTAKIKKYLKQQGIADEDMQVSPIAVDEYYGPESNYDHQRRVQVWQSVTIQGKNVDGVKAASQATVVLAQQGVNFSTQPPEFLITNLPELRIKLLGKAIEDARARADEIAKASGQRVGKMREASSGVVQVLAPNTIDVSDYGQYDTMSFEKDVMVTVRAAFTLK
jgi:hypothetical protein